MRKHRMIQKTIRRVGLVFPIVVFAMLLIAATSNESAARKHKTGHRGMIGHSRGTHGKIAQNARRHHGKHFARLSRHHRTPQRPLTNQEKEDIVQKIRTLAKSSAGTDEPIAGGLSKTSCSVLSKDDSVIAAEASSPDVQAQIAEAAKEERAEDNVDVSLDNYFKARPDASATATDAQSSAMADALNPAAEVERQQDFTLLMRTTRTVPRSART